MRSSEAIERVLTLQTMNTHESEACAHSGDCPSCKELESLCPRLAKALRIAMEALDEIGEFNNGASVAAKDALIAIAKVFE